MSINSPESIKEETESNGHSKSTENVGEIPLNERPRTETLRLLSSQFPIYVSEDTTDGKTNAYGQMVFVGAKVRTRSKYIRFGDDVDLQNVGALMQQNLGLKEWPKIMVSFVGGVQDYTFPSDVECQLRTELQQFCTKLNITKKNTWFITDGTDTSLVNILGDALKGNRHLETDVIGITAWSMVHDNDKLVQLKSTIKIPTYRVRKVSRIAKSISSMEDLQPDYYLSQHHTHFFLIDTDRNITDKADILEKEIKFRANLERYVVNKRLEVMKARREACKSCLSSKEDVLCTAVQIVVHGNLKAIDQIKCNLFPDPTMPVVVVANTGGAADWIVWALLNIDNEYDMEKMPTDFKEVFAEKCNMTESEIAYVCGELQELVMKRYDYITISGLEDLRLAETFTNLEDAVLNSFLKNQRMKVTKSSAAEKRRRSKRSESLSTDIFENDKKEPLVTYEQLKMLMLWERPDLAEENFAKYLEDLNSVHTPAEKEQRLFSYAIRSFAIESNNFTPVIINLGFDITKFSIDMLKTLYEMEFKKKLKEDGPFCLPMAEVLDINILQSFLNSMLGVKVVDYYTAFTEDTPLEDPFKDLFLWAILCNKRNKAEASWALGETPLAKALVGRKLYRSMAHYYKYNHPHFSEKVYNSFLDDASYFGDKALRFVERCTEEDKENTIDLLSTKLPQWGNKTCIELAALSSFKEFIGFSECEISTYEVWKGNIGYYGGMLNFMVVLGLFLPFIIPFYSFRTNIKHKRRCCKNNDKWYWRCACKINLLCDKLLTFYGAPVTKFFRNAILYISFLCVFAHVMLNEMRDLPSIEEKIVLGFVIVFAIDEITQILQTPGINLRQILGNWWKIHWNKLEFIAVLIYILSYVLRESGINRRRADLLFIYGRFFYALDFFLWCMRLLQIISLHKKMGVYVLVIQKMVADVFYFIIIICVFVLAYSIARFSVLFQTAHVSFQRITVKHLWRKLLLVPFFQVLGEPFIDKDNSNGTTVFGTKFYESDSQSFVLFFTFLFMVLTNILFMNLLIAVFNNTYMTVIENSEIEWKWQFYHLVKDYKSTSIVPPPLSVIPDLYHVYRYFHKSKVIEDSKRIDMIEYFEADTTLYGLMEFENECLSIYEKGE